MLLRSNAHTHTTFCDGKNTPEEMVQGALAKGFVALGFTMHSDSPFDPHYSITPQTVQAYLQEIRRLKEVYRDQIAIYLGVEKDFYSHIDRQEYDYIIGSNHYMLDPETGIYHIIDWMPPEFEACLQQTFHGDVMALVQAYYDNIVQLVRQERPEVIGHLDLLRRCNARGHFFDEEDPAYRRIALDAVDRIAAVGGIFEVNTGGVYGGYLDTPYPSAFLLRHILEVGAKVTVTSDSHCVDSLDFYFPQAVQLLREIGFSSVEMLGQHGFETVPLTE